MRSPTASEIAAQLAGRAAALARELLPAGHREGAEWVAPAINGTSPRATSVRITGDKIGVWADFSSELRGDALDLVAVVLYRGDKRAAYRWALEWLGIGRPGAAPAPQARPAVAARAPDAHESATRKAALRLFLAAEEGLANTPADFYLQARGIDLRQLGRQPRALRFHPACRCKETETDLPAMVAAISGADGAHLATHRTYLAHIDGVWRKAKLQAPKKVLGSYAGGSIRLWRGASGKPLANAPDDDVVVIGEGIETCLSVALACPEYRVIAAAALSNLGRIELPAQVLDVIIAADRDKPGSPAAIALDRAVDRLLAQGRSVRLAYSSAGKDFNDAMMAGT